MSERELLIASPPKEDADGDFLRWLAGWLDLIDPILQAVFGRPSAAYTDAERERVIAWLDGKDVQERLRAIAAGHTDLGTSRG
jgi:hypothetical protein